MTEVDAFAEVAVLCIGDVMLDRFVSGAVERVSPESPVPVLSIRGTRLFPGGAANVARNIAALGGRCTLVGVLGSDRIGDELAASVAAIDGVTPVFLIAAGRPTTEKVRFVAQGQQLLRTDQEDTTPLTPDLEQRLLDSIAQHLDGHQVMVLSDYAKGVLTTSVVRGAIAMARQRHMPVIVDPKSPEMAHYSGATIVTPNAKEVHAATGLNPTEDDAVAELAGQRILDASGIESVLVTRAHKGMTLVSRSTPPVHLAAHAREVFDVVGAGDTVVATLAAAIGAGQTLPAAALLANVAAGIVVGKRGTATVSPRELVQELVRVASDPLAPVRGKVMHRDDVLAQVDHWRREGDAIGLVLGRFEAIDASHVSLLSLARSRCDRLVVVVQRDPSAGAADAASASRADEDRVLLLAAFSPVDAVVRIDDEASIEIVRALAPDLLVNEERTARTAVA